MICRRRRRRRRFVPLTESTEPVNMVPVFFFVFVIGFGRHASGYFPKSPEGIFFDCGKRSPHTEAVQSDLPHSTEAFRKDERNEERKSARTGRETPAAASPGVLPPFVRRKYLIIERA